MVSALKYYLGIDTSNYTTSAAVCSEDGEVIAMERRLLPVAQGGCGLRQSDAVFAHTKQLGEVVSRLRAALPEDAEPIAVGCSTRPRDVDGSYMPCFLVGRCNAMTLSAAASVPMYEFSHQAGHVEAAIYGSGAEQLHGKRFYAFHVSGGTTELLEVSEDGTIECIGGSADINAGQLIDRVGVMLGMHFPCGPELEALALRGIASGVSLPERPRVCVRGLECNLSGFENKARHMLDRGEGAESVAMYTLEAVALSLSGLRDELLRQRGAAPLLFSGGVMSCSLIKPRLAGDGMLFAPPRFSADNAAGIALLCRARHIGGKKHLRDN